MLKCLKEVRGNAEVVNISCGLITTSIFHFIHGMSSFVIVQQTVITAALNILGKLNEKEKKNKASDQGCISV